MPISYAKRTHCMACNTPSMRSPRRACSRGCDRMLCSTCRPYCPCRKLPTDWIQTGIKVTAYGRYGGPWTVVEIDGDSVKIRNGYQPPRVLDVKRSDLLPTS